MENYIRLKYTFTTDGDGHDICVNAIVLGEPGVDSTQELIVGIAPPVWAVIFLQSKHSKK